MSPTTPGRTDSPGGSLLTQLSWRARGALSPERRRAVRRLTDRWVGPAGSVNGAEVSDAVALTFDDGPGEWTSPILGVLERHGATATFFVMVDRAESDPGRLREILDRGHEVALHGLDHRRLTRMDPRHVRAHVAEGKDRLEACAEAPVRFFRPPFGSQTPRTFLAARRCGLTVVAWTSDADDWIDHDPTEIAELAVERVGAGGVLLLHDGFESDPALPLPEPTFDRARAVDLILAGLDARGLQGRSVGGLLCAGRTRRTAWFRP